MRDAGFDQAAAAAGDSGTEAAPPTETAGVALQQRKGGGPKTSVKASPYASQGNSQSGGPLSDSEDHPKSSRSPIFGLNWFRELATPIRGRAGSRRPGVASNSAMLGVVFRVKKFFRGEDDWKDEDGEAKRRYDENGGSEIGPCSRRSFVFFLVLAAAIFVAIQLFIYGQVIFLSGGRNKIDGDNFVANGLKRALISNEDAAPKGLLNVLGAKGKSQNELLNKIVELIQHDEDGVGEDDPLAKQLSIIEGEETSIEDRIGWPNLHDGRVLKKVADAVSSDDHPVYTKEEWYELEWSYTADEKLLPYKGNKKWMDLYSNKSRQFLNSLAVFPHAVNDGKEPRMHGRLGMYPNGTQAWAERPKVPKAVDAEGGRAAAMKNGGFYLNLSQALPLDRWPSDGRDPLCLKDTYNYSDFTEDVSIIITFFNEPLSTLLRGVHSVLNQTPPPLLREIILVDDHSNLTDNLPGGPLYEYVKLLPKVKLMRLPERRGLVWARAEGIQLAKAPVIVILDSHIEVNEKWLEPQILRLQESPKSWVFPQIFSLLSDTFEYNKQSGIGCFLSFKWAVVEQATLTGPLNTTLPIPSATMGGGLFAVRKDWFEELGGYDEGMSMWGAENVESGFRTWQCGGRMECTPCAVTYHIYRDGGVGYSSPSGSLTKNRMRSARAWMDDWYQIALKFISPEKGFDFGNIDNYLEVKKRLNCKPFSWFMQNVDPTHDAQNLADVELLGAIENLKYKNQCLDSLNHYKPGEAYGVFYCHGGGGTQGFYKVKTNKKIRMFHDETKCLGAESNPPKIVSCFDDGLADVWHSKGDQLIFKFGTSSQKCLGMKLVEGKHEIELATCSDSDETQKWSKSEFRPDPDFALPDFSLEYKQAHDMV